MVEGLGLSAAVEIKNPEGNFFELDGPRASDVVREKVLQSKALEAPERIMIFIAGADLFCHSAGLYRQAKSREAGGVASGLICDG